MLDLMAITLTASPDLVNNLSRKQPPGPAGAPHPWPAAPCPLSEQGGYVGQVGEHVPAVETQI